jgi:DNA modification methylase
VLLEDALFDISNRDEIVLEPFAGSGSTLVAAEATERVCRAIEIDGLYYDAIVRRWQDMTGGDAVLEETGEIFATVEGQRLRGGEV